MCEKKSVVCRRESKQILKIGNYNDAAGRLRETVFGVDSADNVRNSAD